jgi:hypothetical protein
MRLGLAGACAAAFMAGSGSSNAAVTNRPAADTFILNSSPNNNAGGHSWFDVGTDGVGGNRRGLMRFDLSNIPAGATITSAVLRLTVVVSPGHGTAGADSTVDLLRLLAEWGEGTKAGNVGSAATSGEATWDARKFGEEDWTAGGALSDAAASASASTLVGAPEGASYAWSGPGLINDIQFWLDNPAQNFGWLLHSQDEGTSRTVRAFGSKEHPTSGATLVVGYTEGTTGNTPPTVSITNPPNDAVFTSSTLVWEGARPQQ